MSMLICVYQVWPEAGADAWLRASAIPPNVPEPVRVSVLHLTQPPSIPHAPASFCSALAHTRTLAEARPNQQAKRSCVP